LKPDFDLIVIGGGPAGSTVASFVAMQGHRVLLLEREQFPVYKIGESLLPSTVHGVCSLLGVTEELKLANFVKKDGGTFLWGKSKEPWRFSFSSSAKLHTSNSYAYQVERMKFDSILLNNARRLGVEVLEQKRASDLITIDGRVSGVRFADALGTSHTMTSKYVVDASGHTSRFGNFVGERIFSRHFRNIAIFAYFYAGKRLPHPHSGNIFSVAFERGWFWYIPLSDSLTSVGAVIGEEHAGILKQGRTAALNDLICTCPQIRELLSHASRVEAGPYGETRLRRDYSYCHSRFWRPGLALIGDTACFVDPVLSSGVHLATYAGLIAARSINTYLKGNICEEESFLEFERRYRREYGIFYNYLAAFYDIDQNADQYYWAARKLLNSQEVGNEAFIQLAAGIATSGESLAGPGKSLFPIASPCILSQNDDLSTQRKAFMNDLLTENVQMRVQAAFADSRLQDSPLFEEGLVPSRDGYHWSKL
jgi:halogenation protein CepH